MALMYELTGYDRITKRLVIAIDVPERRAASAKQIAEIPESSDGLGSVPLSNAQAEDIARIVEVRLKDGDYEYFLEPFPDEPSRSMARGSLFIPIGYELLCLASRIIMQASEFFHACLMRGIRFKSKHH